MKEIALQKKDPIFTAEKEFEKTFPFQKIFLQKKFSK